LAFASTATSRFSKLNNPAIFGNAYTRAEIAQQLVFAFSGDLFVERNDSLPGLTVFAAGENGSWSENSRNLQKVLRKIPRNSGFLRRTFDRRNVT
jgi:hypothetical protein